MTRGKSEKHRKLAANEEELAARLHEVAYFLNTGRSSFFRRSKNGPKALLRLAEVLVDEFYFISEPRIEAYRRSLQNDEWNDGD